MPLRMDVEPLDVDEAFLHATALSPETATWFVSFASADEMTAPDSSVISTVAGPYGFERQPIESHRGGCIH